jgi:hypothetical protein
VLVSMMDGDLVDHDARLEDEIVERLPNHGDQTQAIVSSSECFLVATALATTRLFLATLFYLIRTDFTLGEPVFLVEVFRLYRLERIFLVFKVWTQ